LGCCGQVGVASGGSQAPVVNSSVVTYLCSGVSQEANVGVLSGILGALK
jgi:hypothetical protein